MSRIVVIGAHGKVARLAIPLLVAAEHDVTGVIRKPEQADAIRAAGATALVADVERLDVDGLVDVLKGHDATVWLAGAGGGDPARTYAVDRDAAIRTMDAAAQAGVPTFVMVSYFGAGPDHGVPPDNPFFAYADAKSAADEHLIESGLSWTILRPSGLTDAEPTDRIATGSGVTAGRVSRGNVARVIVAVVAVPDADAHRIIEFNDGDQPIAALVARVAG